MILWGIVIYKAASQYVLTQSYPTSLLIMDIIDTLLLIPCTIIYLKTDQNDLHNSTS